MQAMKRFSKWEEREERKMHADMRQQQPGVLFLDKVDRDPIAPDAHAGVLHVPDQATASQPGGAVPSSASARWPHRPSAFAAAKEKGKGRAAELLPLLPRRLDRLSSSKGLGPSGSGVHTDSKDVLADVPVEEPSPSSGPVLGGRLMSAPAELPTIDKGKGRATEDGGAGAASCCKFCLVRRNYYCMTHCGSPQ